MCVNEREAGDKVKMQGVEVVVRVNEFQHLRVNHPRQWKVAMESAKKR